MNQDAIEEPIVLEMHIVDHQQPWVQHQRPVEDLLQRSVAHDLEQSLQRPEQDQLCHDDGGSLEVDCSPSVVVQIIDLDNLGIDLGRKEGEEFFKPGEKGRVVQCPFACVLWCESALAVVLCVSKEKRVCCPRPDERRCTLPQYTILREAESG